MRMTAARLFTTLALLLMMSSFAGCVTKKLFRQTAQNEDKKIGEVQTGVEENERRTGDLKSETQREVARLDAKTDEARQTAEAASTRAGNAEKLAKGKVLWEVTLTNDQVKFGFNKAKVPPEASSVLDDLAGKVKALNKSVYIEVEGHTDSVGSKEYNNTLGLRRAEAVRSYLNQTDSLPLHLISVISYGKTKPVAENSTRKGRAQNRRVVVRVLE